MWVKTESWLNGLRRRSRLCAGLALAFYALVLVQPCAMALGEVEKPTPSDCHAPQPAPNDEAHCRALSAADCDTGAWRFDTRDASASEPVTALPPAISLHVLPTDRSPTNPCTSDTTDPPTDGPPLHLRHCVFLI
jgi:hypothetical protein